MSQDKTFGTCEFCGSTMTLPKIDDEQRAAAFNRGNHFRRIGEFDKALAVYERIVAEDNTDAEAHWCCALCRFGIEYVEDPATYEWLPTCHRASFDSFLKDVDYLAAVEYSDGITKREYQKQGAKIADVQHGILATSQKEEPFDVFICYKETDENSERTVDSTLAQDVYYQLADKGYRVFFSRITLENKGGAEYEPYIFAALNSAKVMIAIGTKSEHFNAVWVKNEWSRYLSLMKKDRGRLLLPCYRDMDPYDLPEQLSVLQSYDMSKIGFIQDLIHGIEKVLSSDKKDEQSKETVVREVVSSSGANADALLKRGYMALEDRNWDGAVEFFDRVLDIDAECAEAYLGCLLSNLRVPSRDYLEKLNAPFDENNNYKKAYRFGDDELKGFLAGCIKTINDRNEELRIKEIFARATNLMTLEQESGYEEAAASFQSIIEYRNSKELYEKCMAKAEEMRKERTYKSACAVLSNSHTWKGKETDIDAFQESIKAFESLGDYKDSKEKIIECKKKIEEIKEAKEKERIAAEQARIEELRIEEEKQRENELRVKRNKRLSIAAILVITICVTIYLISTNIVIPAYKYNLAKKYEQEEKYTDSYYLLVTIRDYKDVSDLLKNYKACPSSKRIKGKNISTSFDYIVMYRYDKKGNCIYSNENGKITQYEYDEKNNLIAEKNDAGDTETVYQYDRNNNLITKINSYSKISRNYKYDDKGNCMYETYGGEIIKYKYDKKKNQLLEKRTSDDVTTYEYNKYNQCIREKINNIKGDSLGDAIIEYSYNIHGDCQKRYVVHQHEYNKDGYCTNYIYGDYKIYYIG